LVKANKTQQYLISISIICSIGVICFFLSSFIGYRIVALLLLMSVSLIAIFFDIFPVLLAALLSAVIWDYFFIPPRFTITVGSTEDLLMLLMYFVIALVNAVLTIKIRQIEKVARQKEEKANTIKLYNTLLNSLSHELRTPIATIIGATDNLLDKENRLTDFNKAELVSEISVAAFRLNHQVDNLLNMSRIESGFLQPKKDWVDVTELVYSVVNRLKEYTAHHPINIQINDNLPLFKLDFGLMEQVLYNLIYNSTIYTPKYCVISVFVSTVSENLIIRVEDNGIGFPEELTEKVFDKFYRLNNSKTGGTGLGLSIVKGFVEAHDGTIHLENLIGGGARFTIVIPAEASYLNNLKNE
jgi:two-component system, OmpR family, sensor histidine kinase KdpD